MPREYPAPDFEVEDLEAFAIEKGYSDKEAYDLADRFRVDAPEWSVRYYTYSKDDLDDQEYTPEEKQLMLDFLEHHNLYEICILK